MLWTLLACTGTSPLPPDDVPLVIGDGEAPAYTGLVINEVMADNESTLQLADGALPDWLELYNGGDETLDLERVTMWDDARVSWTGRGTLAPGETLLLYADDLDGEDHLPFTLDKEGDEVRLAVDDVIVDRVVTGLVPADVALARVPNGGAWYPTVLPSPGENNAWAGTGTTDARDSLFRTDHVTRLSLTLDDEDIAALSGSWGSGEQVEVSMTYEGIFFERVGMKLKGSGSYQDLDGKPGIKIDINDHEVGRTMRGLQKLTFNNANHDATWTHEYISYLLFREAGQPAPRVGWTRIEINGEDYGLFVNVETYDDRFLERWYANPDGELYEGGDFRSGYTAWMNYESGPEPQDTTWIDEISALVAQSPSDDNYRQVAEKIDIDQFTRHIAVETVTADWDGYLAPNNWRFYRDPTTGRVQWLPTGLDFTWYSELYSVPYGSSAVTTWCYASPACLEQFEANTIEVAELAQDLELVALFNDLTDWLNPEIVGDPRTGHTFDSIRSERATTRALLEDWPQRVIDELSE